MLVPTIESKFLAKWRGPYEVWAKVNEGNYKVYQPGKRKSLQIYHVNLIKPWKDREVLIAVNELRELPSNVPAFHLRVPVCSADSRS